MTPAARTKYVNFTWAEPGQGDRERKSGSIVVRVRSIPNSATRNSVATAITTVSVSTTVAVNVAHDDPDGRHDRVPRSIAARPRRRRRARGRRR